MELRTLTQWILMVKLIWRLSVHTHLHLMYSVWTLILHFLAHFINTHSSTTQNWFRGKYIRRASCTRSLSLTRTSSSTKSQSWSSQFCCTAPTLFTVCCPARQRWTGHVVELLWTDEWRTLFRWPWWWADPFGRDSAPSEGQLPQEHTLRARRCRVLRERL